MKPLYGLSESGNLWYKTPNRHHREELGMKIFQSDPAPYIKRDKNKVIGLSGIYVDDMIRAGSADFCKHSLMTHTRFEVGNDEELPCTFTDFMITRNARGDTVLHQYDYHDKLKIIPEDPPTKIFFQLK